IIRNKDEIKKFLKEVLLEVIKPEYIKAEAFNQDIIEKQENKITEFVIDNQTNVKKLTYTFSDIGIKENDWLYFYPQINANCVKEFLNSMPIGCKVINAEKKNS
ncbi:MAG: hypothetical protein HUJ61_03450, partial [Bacilli bacterium]|nr:hypothetical protein [Bacilli bacterium]